MEADVCCLAANVMANPGGRDALRIGRDGALEALDNEVGTIKPPIWEIWWLEF